MRGRTLFEFDEQTTAQNGQGLGFFAVGTLVAAALGSRFLADELQLAPVHLWVTAAVFAVRLRFVDQRLYASGRVFAPELWAARGLGTFTTQLVTSAYAAPSALTFPPTWTLTLISAVMLGATVKRVTLDWAVMLFAATVGYHVVAAPAPSLASVSAATGVAVLALGVMTLVNRLTRRTRATERATQASVALAADAEDDTRRLAASMALHDGLSGLIFVARTRLAQVDSLDAALPLAAPLVAQGRELLGDTTQTAVALAAHVRAVARGVDTRCVVDPAFDGLAPLERLDVRFVVLEQVANALKHRTARQLDVTVELGRERVMTTRCRGPAVDGGAASGQGLRNATLRAQSWSGEAMVELGADESLAVARWPEPNWTVQRWGLWGLLLATLAPLAWLGRGSPVVVGFSALSAVTAALAQVLAFRQLRRALQVDAASRQRRAAVELFKEEHAAALRGAVDAVASAQAQSVGALRAAVDALASCVTTTMRALAAPPAR